MLFIVTSKSVHCRNYALPELCLMSNTPIPHILPNNTLMLPPIAKTRDSSQLRIHRFEMKIRVAHQHLAQEVYAMSRVPIGAIVFKLRHGHIVAVVHCVEKNVICMSDRVLVYI
jgi:hypothetical protein